MEYNDKRMAGSLLFIGGVQFLMMMIVAEALYPSYSVSENWISDLGVGDTSLLFNSSVFFLGVMGLVAAFFIRRTSSFKSFFIVLTMASVGITGVGLFSEDFGIIHSVFSLMTFLFGGFAAILSYKLQKPPFSYLSVLLGAVTLFALTLTLSGVYLGLGKGGMERMIAYPALLWAIGFGGYLAGCSRDMATS